MQFCDPWKWDPAVGFHSSNAQGPIYNVGQTDMHAVFGKGSEAGLQWNKVFHADRHPPAASCPLNRWYKDEKGWQTIH
jgi:hypothetical protein